MAKYQTKCFTNAKPLYTPDDAGAEWSTVEVEFPSTALAANDIIEVATLPKGLTVEDFLFNFPDIDTGAAAFAFSFGELNALSTDLAVVYQAGITAGQSTAVVRNASSVSSQSPATAERKLGMKITTAAATYAGANAIGKILLLLQG